MSTAKFKPQLIGWGWSFSGLGMVMQLSARLPARIMQVYERFPSHLEFLSFIENFPFSKEFLFTWGMAGNAIVIIALILIARSKKRCWAWGLLGIFSFAGMIAVALLKRRVTENAE